MFLPFSLANTVPYVLQIILSLEPWRLLLFTLLINMNYLLRVVTCECARVCTPVASSSGHNSQKTVISCSVLWWWMINNVLVIIKNASFSLRGYSICFECRSVQDYTLHAQPFLNQYEVSTLKFMILLLLTNKISGWRALIPFKGQRPSNPLAILIIQFPLAVKLVWSDLHVDLNQWQRLLDVGF